MFISLAFSVYALWYPRIFRKTFAHLITKLWTEERRIEDLQGPYLMSNSGSMLCIFRIIPDRNVFPNDDAYDHDRIKVTY